MSNVSVDFFEYCPINLQLILSRHAEIIVIVKRLIQGREDKTRVRVEPRSCDQGRKNDAFTFSVTQSNVKWGIFFNESNAGFRQSGYSELQRSLVAMRWFQSMFLERVLEGFGCSKMLLTPPPSFICHVWLFKLIFSISRSSLLRKTMTPYTIHWSSWLLRVATSW